MFKKKQCPKCNKKSGEETNFCPNCGNSFGVNNDDFGMLGKDDSVNQFGNFDELSNSLFGGVGKNILGKMLNNAMKMLEKEMQKEMNSQNFGNPSNAKFELFINGERISPDKIIVSHKRVRKSPEKKIQTNFVSKHFSLEQQKNFSNNLKEEPKTSVKRFSDRIVYEIDIPGVESVKDVSIIKLENSIEIKAISRDKAYLKKLQVDFPIISYELANDKLILELADRE
jgi:HSP20 family molecular chaperone IbpA